MLNAIQTFSSLGIRLNQTLLVYHEDEETRNIRMGGLKGAALFSQLGNRPKDKKVRISAALLQHLTRQELQKLFPKKRTSCD